MSLSTEQKNVRAGMMAAALFSILFICGAYYLLPDFSIGSSLAEHLIFALHCDLFAVLALLLGIIIVATERFCTPTAIGGENLASNIKITINVNYIQNTLEQFVLLFVAHLTIASLLSSEQLKLIPILVSLFLFSRLCFWIGYHKNPTSRAFGFAASFYPTAFVLIYCAGYLILKS